MPADSLKILRELLLRAQYLEDSVVERLQQPDDESDPLGVLTSLFIKGLGISLEPARAALGSGLEAALELELLERQEDSVRAAAMLYPLEDLWIASDFPGRTSGSDFVFPAASPQTAQFHSILPEIRCEALLDVGAGAGAATLLAARDYAGYAWGGDVSARCLRYAELNRGLNAVDNAEFRLSDVYDGFVNLTFDRIIAHPPYIPSLGGSETYRHGGPLGESILERLAAGLNQKLRPGGRAYLSCLGCDTAEAPFERRLRTMLGPEHAEFSVLVAEWESLPPVEFVLRLVDAGELQLDEAQSQIRAFRDAGVTGLVRAAAVVARDGAESTLRRQMGRFTTAAELDAVFEPIRHDERPILDQKLALSPQVELETTSVVHQGRWRAATSVLQGHYPFAFRSDCPAWACEMLPRLNNGKTARELLAHVEVDLDEAEIFLECLRDAGVVVAERS